MAEVQRRQREVLIAAATAAGEAKPTGGIATQCNREGEQKAGLCPEKRGASLQ